MTIALYLYNCTSIDRLIPAAGTSRTITPKNKKKQTETKGESNVHGDDDSIRWEGNSVVKKADII